ncbi:RNA-directed DNA polymerase, eukaryota [Tanacetum coccineum]
MSESVEAFAGGYLKTPLGEPVKGKKNKTTTELWLEKFYKHKTICLKEQLVDSSSLLYDNRLQDAYINSTDIFESSIFTQQNARGGIEEHLLADLTSLMDSVTLSNSGDRWVCDLVSDGNFRVKEIRNYIDDLFLPHQAAQTRWIKYIPIKVNIFAWRARQDCLPTRVNLIRRGIPLLMSSLCRLLWWGLDPHDWSSFQEWQSWILSIQFSSKNCMGFMLTSRNANVLDIGGLFSTRLDSLNMWLGPKARVIMWPKPRGLVHLVYVIKSPQSRMILPADHVLRAVINARLSATLFPPGVIYFYAVPLLEMVESFCNSYYIPDEVHPTAPGRDRTITQFPEGKVGVYTRVFPISVPLYTGGMLEKDPAPHLTARQEQAVQVLSSNKAPFRRYPKYMGLLDYIRTADPRKVQAMEVQKGEEQVTLLESIKHCFVSLDAPAAVHQASGSGSGAGPEVAAPSAGKNVVAEENVIPVGTYVDLIDPEDGLTVVEKGDAAQKQPEKAKSSDSVKLPLKCSKNDILSSF